MSDLPDKDEVLDPRIQECMGLYLYGAGYMERDDKRSARVKGQAQGNYCHEECPLLDSCQERHAAHVTETQPEEAEKFGNAMRSAVRDRGIPESMAEAALQKQNPFMLVAIENYKAGLSGRRRADIKA